MNNIGVIFDCDGTLLDSMGAWRSIDFELAQRAGVTLTKADTDKLVTMTIPEAGVFFHERFGLGTCGDDVVRMVIDIMLEFYRERAELRPGVLEFVQALAQRGVRMSVASASPPQCLHAGLERCGLLPYFEAVVSAEELGVSKREPAVYHHACELMGTERASTWVFEDSSYAVRTALAGGYRTVGVYDCDFSGTYEQLSELAHRTIRTFEGITPEELFAEV